MDSILEVLVSRPDSSKASPTNVFELMAHEKGFNNRDVFIMCSQMVMDGYIDDIVQDYAINVKGILFWDEGKGGYVKKAIKDALDDARIIRNEMLLRNYTLVLACGTVALVLAEITIHWDAFYSQILKWFSCH